MDNDESAHVLGYLTALRCAVACLTRNQPANAQTKIRAELQELIRDSAGSELGEYRAGLEDAANWIIKTVNDCGISR